MTIFCHQSSIPSCLKADRSIVSSVTTEPLEQVASLQSNELTTTLPASVPQNGIKTDALQNGVITFRLPSFQCIYILLIFWLQYLFGVKLNIMTFILIQAFDPKAFHFLTVARDQAWELQILQVAGHFKPMNTGDHTIEIPLFLLTCKYMAWLHKLEALRMANLLPSRWLSSSMGLFLWILCFKV